MDKVTRQCPQTTTKKVETNIHDILYTLDCQLRTVMRDNFFVLFFPCTSGLLRWATYRVYRSMVVAVHWHLLVQELCESRGGHPGLSILTSLLVSMDLKLY